MYNLQHHQRPIPLVIKPIWCGRLKILWVGKSVGLGFLLMNDIVEILLLWRKTNKLGLSYTLGKVWSSASHLAQVRSSGAAIAMCKATIRDESSLRQKKAETLAVTVKFHENTGFVPIGFALSGNRRKIPEVRFQLSLLWLHFHLCLTGFFLSIWGLYSSKI